MINLERLAGKRILVVDDEPDLRGPLATEFESLGCVVFQAGNGKSAFEIVKNEKIDAVVSDIRMPGGDGIELLKNIKAFHHAFPIVMLITGFSDLSREEAYHLGAEAILAKPFDLDELDETLVRILTPSEEKWAGVCDPDAIKGVIAETFTRIDQASKDGNLALGRGGLFLRQTDKFAFVGQRLSVQVKFKEGDLLVLDGCGLVRWVRREEVDGLPSGCGIEFEALSPESRDAVLRMSERLRLVPFIPKM